MINIEGSKITTNSPVRLIRKFEIKNEESHAFNNSLIRKIKRLHTPQRRETIMLSSISSKFFKEFTGT